MKLFAKLEVLVPISQSCYRFGMTDDNKKSNDTTSKNFLELVEIIHRLRAPGGCPWDREQTPESLKPYVIEEAFEVVEAIDGGDQKEICEELGDLMLQVVLQSEIASQNGHFTIDDVMKGISQKLIYRHPHVFGDTEAKDASQVLTNWEKLKEKEKGERGLFDGLPKSLPMLQQASRIGEKAGRVGFDWDSIQGVRDKVVEELQELDEAIAMGKEEEITHELGDLLFAIAQWARHLGHQPEEALRRCCNRFLTRFSKVEQILKSDGKTFKDVTIIEMERIWQTVKEAQ